MLVLISIDIGAASYFEYAYPKIVHRDPYFTFIPLHAKPLVAAFVGAALMELQGWRQNLKSLLLLAGLGGNTLTSLWFGTYRDYVYTGISYINLSDVYITIAIILIVAALLIKTVPKKEAD